VKVNGRTEKKREANRAMFIGAEKGRQKNVASLESETPSTDRKSTKRKEGEKRHCTLVLGTGIRLLPSTYKPGGMEKGEKGRGSISRESGPPTSLVLGKRKRTEGVLSLRGGKKKAREQPQTR